MQEREPRREVRPVPEEGAESREEMLAGAPSMMMRTAYAPAWYSRISLSSVVAGAFIAFTSFVVLLFLGYAIGFGLTPVNSITDLRNVGTAVGVWIEISGALAFFLGSYATSRFANLQYATNGLLHGITTWAFASIISLPFLAVLVSSVLTFSSSWVSAALGIPTTATVTPDAIQNAANVTALASVFAAVGLLLALAASLLGGWLGSRMLRMGEAMGEEMGHERMAA